jgi:sugar phosphate isomerase/epimerase
MARRAAVHDSGLRGTGFQVLRDFEGLVGHLHHYKVDIAKTMLEMCAALGCKVLLACSSTSAHASRTDLDHLARDLRKLAMLALPLGIRIAYEGLSWGRTVNEFTTAWDVVSRADCPNLGPGHRLVPHLRGQDPAGRDRLPRPAEGSSWCSSPTSCGRTSAPSKSA